MGGHGEHDLHHANSNNVMETDGELSAKIRSIDLIKFNPNLFHMNAMAPATWYEVLGGVKTGLTAIGGAALSWQYYQMKLARKPAHFYQAIWISGFRIAVGLTAGTWVGFMKFGDRQKMHNAWVAERLRRRYPDSITIKEHDIWRFKGVTPRHEFYRWT